MQNLSIRFKLILTSVLPIIGVLIVVSTSLTQLKQIKRVLIGYILIEWCHWKI